MKQTRFICMAVAALFFLVPLVAAAADIALYYPPEWATKGPQVKAIAEAISESSGLTIKPVVARSYPEIITAFSRNQPTLVYVGSFLQAILHARRLSVPIIQAIDGKELYASVLIAPSTAGTDPVAIVKAAGPAIAYAKGTSSGESGAKAASGGQAAMPASNHYTAVFAVTAGNAKCAFVKDWWWKANQGTFKGVAMYEYPGVSDKKNPDNVLSANRSVSPQDLAKIKAAAMKNAKAFQVKTFREFDPALLEPTLALMKKGNIDPATYTW